MKAQMKINMIIKSIAKFLVSLIDSKKYLFNM